MLRLASSQGCKKIYYYGRPTNSVKALKAVRKSWLKKSANDGSFLEKWKNHGVQ